MSVLSSSQSMDFDRKRREVVHQPAEDAAGSSVGKCTRTMALPESSGHAGAVQRAADGAAPEADIVHAAARQGVSGPGGGLPHLDRIQQLFGRHDVGNVKAHVGGSAEPASRAMGAQAYATGDQVAFRSAPDLHTAAHEAAHVVQQRSGVRLESGVGAVGDSYEQHADAVADQVVRGEPVERLLDQAAQGAGPASPSVQRAPGDVGEVKVDTSGPDVVKVGGDAKRVSPSDGVPIKNGVLTWLLEVGPKKDCHFHAEYKPASVSTKCPTITFEQTVIARTDGMDDTAGILANREASTGASIDIAPSGYPLPAHGLEAAPGGGTQARANTPTQIAGVGSGHGSTATWDDHPSASPSGGRTAVRQFETAAICLETGETFGSIKWGYSKKGDVVTLTGAQAADVLATSASPEFELVRQAFYAGTFQHSLHDFARGSAALTRAHTDELDAMELGRHYLLVGANDNSKGPEDNAALSVQRAQAVKDYLVKKRSVDAAAITIEGHGVEAREPNPSGKEVPANRRVDIRIDHGMAALPGPLTKGSRAEQRLTQGLDWRVTLEDFVNDLTRLRDVPGKIPWPDWASLESKQRALNLWRRRDPTVPNVNEIYKSQLTALKARAEPEPDPTKDKVPRPQAVDDPALKVKPLEPPKSFLDPE
jgi:Domain of unknown function (DUF4157)/OmpA family